MDERAQATPRAGARRAAGLLLVAVVVAATSTAAAPPAGATEWRPPPAVVPDAPTYAHLVSSTGDYVGQGRTRSYTSTEADIAVTATGGRIDVVIQAEETWRATFAPPADVSTVVEGATYSGLSRHPFHDAAVGGLSFSGDGRGCNRVRGSYAIDQATYSGGQLTNLLLRFEQHCDDSLGPLRGQIRYDATAPVPGPPTPTWPNTAFWQPAPGTMPDDANALLLQSDPGDWVGKGVTRLLATPGTIQASGSGQRALVEVDDVDERWRLNLVASDRSPHLAGGTYTDLRRYPFHNKTRGGFGISGNAAGCNKLSAHVVVDAVDQRGSELTELVLRFQQNCEMGTPALRGALRWELPTGGGVPGAPTGVDVTPGPGGATVSWQAPQDTGAGAVTGYEVITYVQGTATGPSTFVGADARTAELADVAPGLDHSYKVRAINDHGPSRRAGDGSAPTIDLGPFATVEALVDRQYRDFVGRPADGAEIALVTRAIEDGTQTPEGFVAAMRDRPEWARSRASVARLYTAFFVRPPDPEGFAFWVDRHASGAWNLNRIALHFAQSGEFRSTYGHLSNQDYVRLLYANVLDRTPDAQGLAFWMARLESGYTRGSIMTSFSESAENIAKTRPTIDVVLVTTAMLRRTPTASELTAATTRLAAGETIDDIVRSILDSPEYAARL